MDCQTADDVRRASNEVLRKRRASWRKKRELLDAPVHVHNAHPARLDTTIGWNGRIWTGGFGYLVDKAYPQRYPIDPRDNSAVKIYEIVRAVSTASGVSVQDIASIRRNAEIVKARHVAMLLAKRLTPKSLPEIGRAIGGRDHTTVIHALAKLWPLLPLIEEKLPKPASVEDWALAGMELVQTISTQNSKCILSRSIETHDERDGRAA